MASEDEPIETVKLTKNPISVAQPELDEEESFINQQRNTKELEERKFWTENEESYKYLYPDLNDPLFNMKIAEKQEFNDTKYDGQLYPINEQAERLCSAEFELSPHQQFVRN